MEDFEKEKAKHLLIFKGIYERIVQESIRLLDYGITTDISTIYNICPFVHYKIEVKFGAPIQSRIFSLTTAYREEIVNEVLEGMPEINDRAFGITRSGCKKIINNQL